MNDNWLAEGMSIYKYLLVNDLVHNLEPLNGLLFRDADVLLLERHGTEAVVEVEESLVVLDAQEGGNVLVVGQSGGETDETNVLLRRLDGTDRPRYDRLQHGT